MKRFVIAVGLAFFLSGSAFAGDMPTGGYAPPEPNDTTQTSPSTAPVEVATADYSAEGSDPTLKVVMAILSFLSV